MASERVKETASSVGEVLGGGVSHAESWISQQMNEPVDSPSRSASSIGRKPTDSPVATNGDVASAVDGAAPAPSRSNLSTESPQGPAHGISHPL